MPLFSDPSQPIATCVSETCDRCPVAKVLHCHFTLRDLTHFLLAVLPSFLVGGAGIFHLGGWWLIPWIFIMLVFFGFIEIRVLCTHCPHYAEPGKSLRCWANYGSPKLWQYRPGPMAFWEKLVFVTGLLLVWGYPVCFLIHDFQPFLLLVYLVTTAGFFITLSACFCSRCMNFACPLNRVEDENRKRFWEKNPGIARAWKAPTRKSGDQEIPIPADS